MAENKLFYGDKPRRAAATHRQRVDRSPLLGPPFKSNQNYNVLFTEHTWKRAAAHHTP